MLCKKTSLELLASEVFLHNISIDYNFSTELDDILVHIDRHELGLKKLAQVHDDQYELIYHLIR
jgi:hypothetical protein